MLLSLSPSVTLIEGIEAVQGVGGRQGEDAGQANLKSCDLMGIWIKGFTANSICKFYMPILEKVAAGYLIITFFNP